MGIGKGSPKYGHKYSSISGGGGRVGSTANASEVLSLEILLKTIEELKARIVDLENNAIDDILIKKKED